MKRKHTVPFHSVPLRDVKQPTGHTYIHDTYFISMMSYFKLTSVFSFPFVCASIPNINRLRVMLCLRLTGSNKCIEPVCSAALVCTFPASLIYEVRIPSPGNPKRPGSRVAHPSLFSFHVAAAAAALLQSTDFILPTAHPESSHPFPGFPLVNGLAQRKAPPPPVLRVGL